MPLVFLSRAFLYLYILSKNYRFFFLGFLAFMISACNKMNRNTDMSRASHQDSISIWIQQARSSDLSKEKRSELLNKAYSKANTTSVDSLKTTYFSNLSLAYLALNDSLQFRKINTEALKLSEDNKDSIRLAEAYWDLASFLSKQAIRDSSYTIIAKHKKYTIP